MTLLPLLGLTRGVPLREPTAAKADPDAPNVLILVFDALSARNMSLYGYPRATTPQLERFANRATVYHRHYAAGNFTTPGVASLLTGTYPWTHRGLHLHGTTDASFRDRNLFRAFADAGYYSIGYSHNLLVTSLMYQFRDHIDELKRTRELCLIDDEYADRFFFSDYNTAFWSEWMLLREGNSPPGSLFYSLFDRALRFVHRKQLEGTYGELFPRGIPHLHSLFFVLEDAIDWLQAQLTQLPRPFVAYVHLLPPHEPYVARRDFVDQFADKWSPTPKAEHRFSEGHTPSFLNQQRREYDEYLAYTDAEFGRLYDGMAQSGVLDNTCVVVTSDHGELFERGIRGHVTPVLYEPVVHIPLLITTPGQTQREDIYTPTNCVDVLPTLLGIAGQPPPVWCEGEVIPLVARSQPDNKRALYAMEAKGNPKHAPLTKATVALFKGQHKLVRYSGYENYDLAYELYDLDKDPEEQENLDSLEEPLGLQMREELEQKLDEVNHAHAGKGS